CTNGRSSCPNGTFQLLQSAFKLLQRMFQLVQRSFKLLQRAFRLLQVSLRLIYKLSGDSYGASSCSNQPSSFFKRLPSCSAGRPAAPSGGLATREGTPGASLGFPAQTSCRRAR